MGHDHLAALILDTCAAIWMSSDVPVAASAETALADARERGEVVFVSPITAWEFALLIARKRLAAAVPAKVWFENLMAIPTLMLTELSIDILINSTLLPGSPPNDPADRIILATARSRNLTIVTRDRLILRYAAEGHVKAIAC
jgi:PIN domain nuclease of toxin-antitoxin system